jgi:hypothetical protein
MANDEKLEMASAIERLYEAFQPYTPPAHPTFCAHCVSDAEDALLYTNPLRQLSAQELKRYSFKAISTWGTVEQFKYLLPRLFELVVYEGFGYDPEILFKKPRYGGLASWPDTEQQAVAGYCGALWRFSLARHPLIDYLPAFVNIEDSLCSVAQIVDDLHPLLQLWDSETTTATLHLADFVAENASTLLANGALSNAFWEERPEQVKQVADWFLTRDFANILDLAELGTLPADVAEELAQAVRRRSERK